MSAPEGGTTTTHSTPVTVPNGVTITERAVQRIATAACHAVPGTVATGGTFEKVAARNLPRIDVRVEQDRKIASIDMQIAVSWPAPVTSVAEKVRGAVASWVSAMTGLRVTRVNVTVNGIENYGRVTAAQLDGANLTPPIRPVTVASTSTRVVSPRVTAPRGEKASTKRDLNPVRVHTRQADVPVTVRSTPEPTIPVEIHSTPEPTVDITTRRAVPEVTISTPEPPELREVRAPSAAEAAPVRTPKPTPLRPVDTPAQAPALRPKAPRPRPVRSVRAPRPVEPYHPSTPKPINAYSPRVPAAAPLRPVGARRRLFPVTPQAPEPAPLKPIRVRQSARPFTPTRAVPRKLKPVTIVKEVHRG